MRAAALALLLLSTACSTVPAPPPYDPACIADSLPDGVSYPAPTDPLERLFPRPRIEQSAGRIVTVRRTGPYSDPEAQVSLIEDPNGTVRAELWRPVGCSVSDQMFAAFLEAPGSSEEERLREVKLEKIEVTDREMPALREFRNQFRRLRLSPNLFEGLVLDTRSYHLWVETPMSSLELSTPAPDPPFAAWAERLIAALSASFQ